MRWRSTDRGLDLAKPGNSIQPTALARRRSLWTFARAAHFLFRQRAVFLVCARRASSNMQEDALLAVSYTATRGRENFNKHFQNAGFVLYWCVIRRNMWIYLVLGLLTVAIIGFAKEIWNFRRAIVKKQSQLIREDAKYKAREENVTIWAYVAIVLLGCLVGYLEWPEHWFAGIVIGLICALFVFEGVTRIAENIAWYFRPR